jgi:hypothetical protein
MLRFAVGLVLGIILGATAVGYSAVVAGDNGYLLGWSVNKDGEEICSEPYIWTASKEIECD